VALSATFKIFSVPSKIKSILFVFFMDEIKPIFNELVEQPVAFLGGLVSGFLKLELQQDPLRSWLEKQGATLKTPYAAGDSGKNDGPQSISID
jgi:hypothetical protein